MILITILKRFFRFLALKNAIREANRCNRITRKRYYVLKVFDKIWVYDRAKIDLLIRSGVLSKNLKSAYELQKFALYFTGQPKSKAKNEK